MVPVRALHTFRGHPFKVTDDAKMQELVNSIREQGIMTPVVVRPMEDGEYELISGHRRTHAAGIVGLENVPAIVREMNDDEATVAMIDANLQREEILPSEKASAYKMKMEAISRHEYQVGTEGITAASIGKEAGDSRNQVFRYIRLTNLLKCLLDLVDEKKMKLNPAVEISYLSMGDQMILVDAMDAVHKIPSLAQAKEIRQLSQKGSLELQEVKTILSGKTSEKKEDTKDKSKIIIQSEEIRRFFPENISEKEMEAVIILALQVWRTRNT